MTTPRRKQGATLALVISLVFVFLLVGACFFIWQLLVGGGKELQHATDSGNLNVAKQALKTPSYTVPDAINPITNTNLRKEFQDVLVDANGSPDYNVNLLNFNRLVGKAVLAQLNAKAEGTAQAAQNAKQLTQAVYSIGQQLQSQLASASSLKSHFEGMSNNNSVRMLNSADGTNNNSAISQTDAEYALSYMARGKASNVYIDPSQIPAGASLGAGDLVTKNVGGNKQFLAGYKALSSAAQAGCPQTWAVPLRPGEQPHLVSVDDFNSNSQEPFQNTLPNAFKSGGQASFVKTGANISLRSCAVVGVLSQTFPIQQSGGVLIIDNTGNAFPVPYDNLSSVNIPDSGNSLFAGPLMAPKGIEIFRVTAYGSYPSGEKSRDYMAYYDGSGPLPSDTIKGHHESTQDGAVTHQDPENSCKTFPANGSIDGTDLWAMSMDSKGRYVSRYSERCQIMGTTGAGSPGQSVGGGAATSISHIATCNNQSFDAGGAAQCKDENNIKNVFPAFLNGDIGVPSGGSGSTTYSNLMPLEQYILNVHGGFGGGSGCVTVPALGPVGGCASGGFGSGMKHIVNSLPPFQEGTLDQLLTDTGTPQSVRDDLATRMRQISPGADPNTIFNATMPYNKVLYIYNEHNSGNDTNTLTMSTSPPSTLQYNYASQLGTPSRPAVINGVPDGSEADGSHNIGVSGNWVPGSYWECGSGRASGQSASMGKWFPSSGKAGLMGVLRFVNCPEADGPDWCCP